MDQFPALKLADAQAFVFDPTPFLMGLDENRTGAGSFELFTVNDGFAVDSNDAMLALNIELKEEPFFRKDSGVGLGTLDAIKRAGGINGTFNVVNLDFVTRICSFVPTPE